VFHLIIYSTLNFNKEAYQGNLVFILLLFLSSAFSFFSSFPFFHLTLLSTSIWALQYNLLITSINLQNPPLHVSVSSLMQSVGVFKFRYSTCKLSSLGFKILRRKRYGNTRLILQRNKHKSTLFHYLSNSLSYS